MNDNFSRRHLDPVVRRMILMLLGWALLVWVLFVHLVYAPVAVEAAAVPASVPTDFGGFRFGDALWLSLLGGGLVYVVDLLAERIRAWRFARQWEPRLADAALAPRTSHEQ